MIYEVGGGIPNGRDVEGCRSGRIVNAGADARGNRRCYGLRFGDEGRNHAGSGGVVVLDDTTCIVKFALRTIQFYQHESCGWCIPCREGTDWLRKTLTRFHSGGGREERYRQHLLPGREHAGRNFCPLGDAAAMPTIGFVKNFREEFEDHLDGRPCPFEKAGTAEPANGHFVIVVIG